MGRVLRVSSIPAHARGPWAVTHRWKVKLLGVPRQTRMKHSVPVLSLPPSSCRTMALRSLHRQFRFRLWRSRQRQPTSNQGHLGKMDNVEASMAGSETRCCEAKSSTAFVKPEPRSNIGAVITTQSGHKALSNTVLPRWTVSFRWIRGFLCKNNQNGPSTGVTPREHAASHRVRYPEEAGRHVRRSADAERCEQGPRLCVVDVLCMGASRLGELKRGTPARRPTSRTHLWTPSVHQADNTPNSVFPNMLWTVGQRENGNQQQTGSSQSKKNFTERLTLVAFA